MNKKFDFNDFYRVVEDSAYGVIEPEEFYSKLIALDVPRHIAHWLLHKAHEDKNQRAKALSV